MLSEVNHAFTGQWLAVGILVLQGLSLLFGLLGYVATKREVDKMDMRLLEVEKEVRDLPGILAQMQQRLDNSDESRTSAVHHRLNPLEQIVARLGGQMDGVTNSFEKMTRIIEATSRQRDDQINAFTRALETFASVLEERKR